MFRGSLKNVSKTGTESLVQVHGRYSLLQGKVPATGLCNGDRLCNSLHNSVERQAVSQQEVPGEGNSWFMKGLRLIIKILL